MKAARIVGLAMLAILLGSATWQAQSADRTSRSGADENLTIEERQNRAREEISLVEEIVSARERYLKNMEKLLEFYRRTGRHLKAPMAKEELEALKKVKQHDYVIIGEALGPDLRPQKIIPKAEQLYKEARKWDALPGTLPEIEKNKRKALGLYLQLISEHHESTRIAEAAYHAAAIYESRNEYYTAVVYYQRAYQWDPLTSHPARIKAARICYYKIKNNRKAKELYEAAMKGSPSAAHRSEGKALANLLKTWGY